MFSAEPESLEPIGFPPAGPRRPWTYGNVIASDNGVVAWARAGAGDDPVAAVAGGDLTRPARLADVRLMRRLRAAADAVGFGAQTLRDQPDVIGAVDDLEGAAGSALVCRRIAEGKPRVPLQVVYSASGALDLGAPIFSTPGVTAIVVTTGAGARRLGAAGSAGRGVQLVVAGESAIDAAGLADAHRQLFDRFEVRRLDCEGGMVLLESLRQARLLDELFVTATDVTVDTAGRSGVRRLLPLEPGARLVAGARVALDPGYRFQRWRFDDPGGRPREGV